MPSRHRGTRILIAVDSQLGRRCFLTEAKRLSCGSVYTLVRAYSRGIGSISGHTSQQVTRALDVFERVAVRYEQNFIEPESRHPPQLLAHRIRWTDQRRFGNACQRLRLWAVAEIDRDIRK